MGSPREGWFGMYQVDHCTIEHNRIIIVWEPARAGLWIGIIIAAITGLGGLTLLMWGAYGEWPDC